MLPRRSSSFIERSTLIARNLQLYPALNCSIHDVVRVPSGHRRLRSVDREAGSRQRALQPVTQLMICPAKMGDRLQRIPATVNGQRHRGAQQYTCQCRLGKACRSDVQSVAVLTRATREAVETMLFPGNRFGEFTGEWFYRTCVRGDDRDGAPSHHLTANRYVARLNEHEVCDISIGVVQLAPKMQLKRALSVPASRGSSRLIASRGVPAVAQPITSQSYLEQSELGGESTYGSGIFI